MRRSCALVIGGTHGSGRALVRLLAGQGEKVAVVGRTHPPDADRELPNVSFFQADACDPVAMETVVKAVSSENGCSVRKLVFFQRFRGKEDDWENEIALSLTATRNIIDLVVPFMPAAGDKSIVAVSSIASRFIASEQPVSYHVGKAGIDQIVRYYAVVLGRKGIRVNSVCPSTMIKDESRAFYESNVHLVDLYEKITPLGRIGTAEECADVVEFLLSTKSTFVTGQNIMVDGGTSLQWPEGLCRSISGINVEVTRNMDEE
jgi:NAD(P)-dependent dehydrogenase (short-subunit alcohol dehydrogenase family)